MWAVAAVAAVAPPATSPPALLSFLDPKRNILEHLRARLWRLAIPDLPSEVWACQI